MLVEPELEEEMEAPKGSKRLVEILHRLERWPIGAMCATQELSGEVLFWGCELREVKRCRERAGDEGLVPWLGLQYQLDSWYEGYDYQDRERAVDQEEAVVTVFEIVEDYISTLYQKRLSMEEAMFLVKRFVNKFGGKIVHRIQDGMDVYDVNLGSEHTISCFRATSDSQRFYFES